MTVNFFFLSKIRIQWKMWASQGRLVERVRKRTEERESSFGERSEQFFCTYLKSDRHSHADRVRDFQSLESVFSLSLFLFLSLVLDKTQLRIWVGFVRIEVKSLGENLGDYGNGNPLCGMERAFLIDFVLG